MWYKKNKIFFVLLIIHLLLIIFFYNIIDIFNGNLIYDYDYPYHSYQNYEAKHYYLEGKSWGYNPFLTAGYIGGISLDNDFFQLLSSGFSFENQIILLKFWLILILFLLPILIYFSSINFSFNKNISLLSVILLLVYIYNDYFFNSLIQFGMYNFVFAAILSLFYLSLVYRYFLNKEKKILIFLFFSLPFFAILHSSVLLMFFIPFFIMFFLNFKKLSFKNNFLIIVPVLLSLLILFFWIGLPFFKQIYTHLGDTSQYFQIKNLKEVLKDLFYNSSGVNKGVQFIKTSILFLGLLGIFNWFKKNKLFYLFSIFFISIYLNNIIKPINFIAQFQPYKFILFLVFLSIIPASYFIINLFNKRKIIFFVLFLLIFLQVPFIQIFASPKPSLHTFPPRDYRHLTNWINQNVNNNTRILFETSLSPKEIFVFPSFSAGLITIDTKKEFLFGPHNDPFLDNNFPSLTSKKIFRKEWDKVNNQELINYLNLYNVGWVIARSKQAKKELNKKVYEKIFIKYVSLNNFNIYKVNLKTDFIIGGDGDIEIDFNKIKINNLKTSNNEIVLKYHWYPFLKERTGAKIEPVYFLNMSVPFIKLSNINSSNLEIYNSYKN